MQETKFKLQSAGGERLDEFLRRELPGLPIASKVDNPDTAFSNSKIRRLIVAGAVSVNGRKVGRPAFELRGRSVVEVLFDPERFFLREAAGGRGL